MRKTIKYEKESDHIRKNIGKARALIFQPAVLPDLKNDLSVAKLAADAKMSSSNCARVFRL